MSVPWIYWLEVVVGLGAGQEQPNRMVAAEAAEVACTSRLKMHE
jgi:hypothetical protein